jgi:hypothetical protein
MSTKPSDIAPASAMALPRSWSAWRNRLYGLFAAGWAVTVTGAGLESFFGLYHFAKANGRRGLLALLAPTMVDTFILGGEILVLLAVMQRWDWRARWTGYAFTWLGLALSVAGNAGQAGWHIPLVTMVSYALAPVAMTGMTAMGLIIVKRHFHPRRGKRRAAWRPWRRAQQQPPELAAVPVPGGENPPVGPATEHTAPWPRVAPELPAAPRPAAVRQPARRPAATTLPAGRAAEADARRHWADHIAAGTVPGIREVKAQLHCGQPRAERVIAAIERLGGATARPGA